MTKSNYRKWKDREFRERGYTTMDCLFDDAKKGFLFEDSDRKARIRRCHRHTAVLPGNLAEGDVVCLVKQRPKKVRRKQDKCQTWTVQYFDRGNGFVQLGNSETFDREGAEKNIAFFRSHNFPITDIWDLDSAFTLFFLPRLKVFIESTRYGIPSNVYNQYLAQELPEDEAEKRAAKAWEDILTRMYEGLTIAYEGPDAEIIRARLKKERNLANQQELWDVEHKMEADARTLFSQYFFSLWD